MNAPQNIDPPQAQSFLTDVKQLREQARRHMEFGAVTETYAGDPLKTIEILQSVLATEIVCLLRYTQNAIAATGLASEGVRTEFSEHAKEEQQHAMMVAERINQLGGAPDFNPETLTARSAAEYIVGGDLVGMIRENLVAERIAIDHYRELVRFFGVNDPATRAMIEEILGVEEEHANDMLDLLEAHGALGR
jgi:bacterioferritin